ncbi:MAG: hypothetical protein PHY73_01305 [Candidatus Omnitrophica bacterium]|nr:hypothetical protein [Candidatus Omnitrophota bacterium]
MTKYSKKFCWILIVFWLAGLMGCSSKKEEQPLSRIEAKEKIEQILENDYDLSSVITWTGDTFWIYVPDENPLYSIAGGKKSTKPVKKKYTLQYIDSIFDNNDLKIEYDIVEATKLSSGNGMSTQYSKEFNTKYRNVTTAISRVFFKAENPPKFIVLVVANIKDGLKTTTTFYTEDLKKYQAGALPPDEYTLRIQTEPSGDEAIKGDAKGTHIEYKDIDIKDFIAKQVTTRINFKFQNSDFPPDKNVADEILDAVVKTIHAYGFEDFSSVVLTDLRANSEITFSKKQINAIQSTLPKEKPASAGKIITIDFSDLMKNTKPDNSQDQN